MRAKVYVTLKKGVLDPQGKAVMGALKSMEFGEVKDVRVGKFMELELDGASREAEEKRLKEMCERLLANTVIENYRIEIE
ncbi:MAG TPA: phosphoribosylformylglycinamidine synthase [Deltaproteobacteria bacterium]|nr:MAG: phosphoribosylformylglycinamidine synthase [Deltaproteobacteria bacterium GWA2_55_82]OGQ64001.1 MAG: phosphoribosylformylglycinamidine synthase [Deltaproteobacteria bacterium RIFCSPLOWO2_02_FULL_55_12]OIJ73434.1 MAG: phosphoribosylformylglycinamidine synthase [Deltaproteobacteria bacterium GWC2_55_46]HBG47297.1 phosphoribosylformylglycinamidine synthase [Deltaproteobacteria bacterium]HCY10063.1 phosphoribosylformylglycinamidine synthase [Deltaproteobacteria bacterium]